MGIRGFTFLALFGFALVAAFVNPVWGILAYLGHYYIWPEKQWWGQMLESAGIRVSLSISIVLALAIVARWPFLKSRLFGPMVHSQEILLVAHVGLICLTLLWGITPDVKPTLGFELCDKLAKCAIFLFMMTHVVTTLKDFTRLMWFAYLVGGVYLGWEARNIPASSFVDGRLDSLGGPDFGESNFAALHFVAMGILGLAHIAKRNRLSVRVLTLGSGVLVANAAVMMRSRGSYVAAAAALICGVPLLERRTRWRIILPLLLAVPGALYLIDENYWGRISSITTDAEQREASSQSRIEIWEACPKILLDHPMGVGVGNFFSIIGQYDPRHPYRDTHNTFLRCIVELGFLGAFTFVLLHVNAFLTLRRCSQLAFRLGKSDSAIDAAALRTILIAYIFGGLTITLTYQEGYFIFLLLPVCLERALLHAEATEAPPLDLGATYAAEGSRA